MSERALLRRTILAGGLALLAACDISTTQPMPSGWDAEILGEGPYSALGGTMGVASQMGSTVAHIAINAAPGTRFSWRLQSGSCTSPGSGVGPVHAYPELLTSSQGSAEGVAQLNQMLNPESRYAVFLRDEDGEIAACGNLQRQVFASNLSSPVHHEPMS